MTTTQVFEIDGDQAIRLPKGFRFTGDTVSIRREGQAVVLEPVGSRNWPPDFFEEIFVDDPAFVRPSQGEMPPAPCFDGIIR